MPANSINNRTGTRILDTLPNYENAVVPLDKLTEYSLSFKNNYDKAFAFEKALGFTIANYPQLLTQVYRNLPSYKVVDKGYNNHGNRYQVVMTIDGVNGKQAEVLTAWIIRNGEDFPRLTNIYVTTKKGVKL
ncbi:MAG: hypothetical protein LBM98_00995 [Oscillospiraceae bacterium]|jgi:hypothetical protein|nr:hypothetical protein [Oscillospiraceae bacterium]